MLTYKEFEERVAALGEGGKTEIVNTPLSISVVAAGSVNILKVGKSQMFSIETYNTGMRMTKYKKELYDLATELSATPLEERVEEQRWHMKSKWLIDEVYLFNKCAGIDETPMLRHVHLKNATAFTRSEIETLRACFGDVVNHYAEVMVME